MLNVAKLANQAAKEGLQLPSPNKNGRYNTMNEKGSMLSTITETDEIFIKIASQPGAKVLEIGAAYGLVCLEALRRGATNYVAIDVEEKHLKILAKQIVEKIPEKAKDLSLIWGHFPKEEVLKYLKQNSFDAILAGNVLHYLTEKEVRETFRQFALLLKPGGKLIATMTTAYLVFLKQDFRDKFEKELNHFLGASEDEKARLALPGYLEVEEQSIDFGMTENAMDSIALSRDHYFLFDQDVVKYLLDKEGFIIEKCDYYTLGDEWKLNDNKQDQIGVIAQKPDE